jgi:hypothetical protein
MASIRESRCSADAVIPTLSSAGDTSRSRDDSETFIMIWVRLLQRDARSVLSELQHEATKGTKEHEEHRVGGRQARERTAGRARQLHARSLDPSESSRREPWRTPPAIPSCVFVPFVASCCNSLGRIARPPGEPHPFEFGII